MKRLDEVMICWNPGGDVAVVNWPDESQASKGYRMTSGACYAKTHKLDHEQRKTLVFIDAVKLIVRDGCDPWKVHQALLGVKEYVDGLPNDMLPKDLLTQRLEAEE